MALFTGLSGGAFAQRNASLSWNPLAQAQRERAVLQEIMPESVRAPRSVELLDQATLQMSGPLAYLPKAKAGPLFRVFDLQPDADLVGVVFNTAALDWLGAIHFVGAGFVRADGLLGWTPDEILRNMRDAMVADNLDRATRGLPQQEIRRWQEPPKYDPERHRLVWSALTVPKGGSPADGDVVYHGFVCGRSGYFRLTAPTTLDQFELVKADATLMLDNLAFLPGKEYNAHIASDPIVRRGVDRLYGVVELRRATVETDLWDDEIVVPAIAGSILIIGALAIGIGRFLMIPRRRV